MQTETTARLIYFPRLFGDGNSYGYPEIIYVGGYGSKYAKGSKLPEDVEEGRFGNYDLNRCLPYTDQTWHLCKQHIKKRNELEDEYKKLCEMARKKTIGV